MAEPQGRYEWWAELGSSRTTAHVGLLYDGEPDAAMAGARKTVATLCDCGLIAEPVTLASGRKFAGYGPPRDGVVICPVCLAKLSYSCEEDGARGEDSRRLLGELGWTPDDGPPRVWRITTTRLTPEEDAAAVAMYLRR